ncbi:hypothetical protein AK812_SmicGene19148 [Symbiodinium microadriaticum]|uniref:Uncharacterized protein n=1 Tax=Symbiodinium microadriaticum TaxID=2951 RepID=A0A1Q9DT99_SYMMI|nr:hypothetical protein AK812_SmicGene19148 [Symbiodinium microadriaticum]CAE7706136.1 unnamed protein product [Symbiodinium microadriaticum]CAE7884410.1 unnamed protein product [Symbiodinium sp. KB8]
MPMWVILVDEDEVFVDIEWWESLTDNEQDCFYAGYRAAKVTAERKKKQEEEEKASGKVSRFSGPEPADGWAL